MKVAITLPSRQTGLSLIELMIAITLGLVLMTGVSQIFLSSKVVFSTQQGLSRIQETGRLAVDFISRDISAAGYYGCYRPVPTPNPITQATFKPDMLNGTPLAIQGLHRDFEVSLIGYNSLALLPGGAGAAGANLGAGVTPEPVSDILVVRSASAEGFPVITDPTSSDQNLVLAVPLQTQLVQPIPCVGNLCAGDAVVVSDCTQARVFQIPVANGSLTLNVPTLTINHPVWPTVVDQRRDGATFLAGSEVRPLNTTVYFLGKRPNGTDTSLWQRTNLQAPVELLEGVEQMRLRYATTGNAIFRRASELTLNDWPLVSAVRLELVVRSIENNVVREPQAYTFDGALVNPGTANPLDRYMRQVFITTVAKRNFN